MDKPAVTEFDLRAEEFKHPSVKPEDYEFRRQDGKIVRKDRWEAGMHSIAAAAGFSGRSGFEIDVVVEKVENVFQALENIDHSYILDVMKRVLEYMPKDAADEANVAMMRDLHEAIQIVEVTAEALEVPDEPDPE